MNRSASDKQRDAAIQQARLAQVRERELAGLEAELSTLERRRSALEDQVRRLRQPVGIDEVRRMAESGRQLTADEAGRLATEDPAAFNRLLDDGALDLAS